MLPLYCEHFGLTREPFNVTPDPSFLYLSASHNEALAQLVYGIRARRGFVVLTGEVGTGKTTLIQSLLEEINDGHTHTALIFNLMGSSRDLLRCVCEDFALIPPKESETDLQDYLSLLNRYLLDCYRKGDNVALIVDEAQNLSAEVLEHVRLLSNFETKQEKLLQILLVGQPELGDRLNQPELRQLKQRVALRHHLNPLNLAECKEYVSKRLELSNCKASLFSSGAMQAVHSYSGGIPRLVNILCDNGLLNAYAQRKEYVDAEMIREIAQDLQLAVAPGTVGGQEGVISKARRVYFQTPNARTSDVADRSDEKPRASSESRPFRPRLILRAEQAAESPKKGSPELRGSRDLRNDSDGRPELRSEIVPRQFFDSMLRRLTEAMGPMASIVLRDHIVAMGESKEAFPKERLVQLVDETSGEIFNPAMKGRFTQAIARELRSAAMDR